MSTFLDAHADQLAAYTTKVPADGASYKTALQTLVDAGGILTTAARPSRIRVDTVTGETICDFDSATTTVAAALL